MVFRPRPFHESEKERGSKFLRSDQGSTDVKP